MNGAWKVSTSVIIGLVAGPVAAQRAIPPPANVQVDFNRHVKPILEAKCFGCHGPTQQQSGLRLDRRQNALRGGDYGPVIFPGRSAESKLILRLVGSDVGMQMPPTGPLEPNEIGLLRAWIDQGGDFPDVVTEMGGPPARVVSPKAQALFGAIRRADLPAVRKMVSAKDSLASSQDGRGATPLMHAAVSAGPDMMRWLLDHGADPNAKNDRGATALVWAISDLAKVRLLVERGADLKAKTVDGRSALHVAAALPAGADVVGLLLEKGADPNAIDITGRTPLMSAAGAGNVESIRVLLAKGAKVNTPSASGNTALMDAARSKKAPAVQALLEAEADVNARTKRNQTALAAAASYGNLEIVRLLVEKGADVNVQDERGYSPLMYAAYSESLTPGVVRLLLSKGADPKATGEGETALTLAKKRGETEVTRLIQKANGGE